MPKGPQPYKPNPRVNLGDWTLPWAARVSQELQESPGQALLPESLLERHQGVLGHLPSHQKIHEELQHLAKGSFYFTFPRFLFNQTLPSCR